MNIKHKIMYHIHTSNEYDDLWQEGNEITIDDNFYSECGMSIPDFNTNVMCSDGSASSLEYFLKKYSKQRNRKFRYRNYSIFIKRFLQNYS